MRGEGLSILIVEHDMDLVMGLVDRVVVMEFGTKLIEGTPEEVQREPSGARGVSRHGALIMEQWLGLQGVLSAPAGRHLANHAPWPGWLGARRAKRAG